MLRTTLLAAAATFALATAALAGPPWISIEYPATPFHPSTRGAPLLVRTYHHATEVGLPVRGTAEGTVDGKRVSRPLDLRATVIPGTYALRSELPPHGTWLLVITATQEKNDEVSAFVTVQDGRIAGVEVPADGNNRPKQITAADVNQRLARAQRP